MIDHCFTILVWFVIQQHELTIVVHISLPSWISLPPPSRSHLSRWLQSPSVSGCLFTRVSHHASTLLSIHLPIPSCSPPLSVSLFCRSASPLLLCEQTEPASPMSPSLACRFFTTGATWKPWDALRGVPNWHAVPSSPLLTSPCLQMTDEKCFRSQQQCGRLSSGLPISLF